MFIHTEFMFSETPFYVLGNSFLTFYFFTEDLKRSLKLPVHSFRWVNQFYEHNLAL